MKKNKLKPFLTGSVLILPAILLLNGTGQETKAMMKSAVGKLVGNIKMNRITIPNVTNGGVKLSSPGVSNAIKRTNSAPTTSTSKFTGPKTNATTSHSFNLGNKVTNSGNLETKTKRPAPQPPTSSSNLVNKVNNAGITTESGLKPKRPAPPPPTSSNKLTNGSLEKPDPGYGTVPKPIFTPKKSGTNQSEPEQYENVVILNTNAGTLTIFKDH